MFEDSERPVYGMGGRTYWIAKYVQPSWTSANGRVWGGAVKYVSDPGHKRWHGMYRNRRCIGVVKVQLTDDRSQAFHFASRADARKRIAKIAGANIEARYQYEKVTVEEGV